MRRFARASGWLLLVMGMTGCVERQLRIESNPPGAMVYHNGQPIGATPVDFPFTYYGEYEFELQKDGYESRKYKALIRRPWFEWFPLDFIAENVYPGHLQDNRRLLFDLQPQPQPRTDDLVNQANQLRMRGLQLPGAPPIEQ